MSMFNSTMMGEKKLLKAEERNIELMSELKKAKDEIKKLKRDSKKIMGKNSNESFLENLNNMTQAFPDDTTFLNPAVTGFRGDDDEK